jgi:O-acetyl-ADP-ribose deacetylase (regulator of RNase III)
VRNALRVASANELGSVAFPLIGAGTGGLSPARSETLIIEEAATSEYDGRVILVRHRR